MQYLESMNDYKLPIITLVGTGVLVAAMVMLFSINKNDGAAAPEALADLATCLTESGAKFYGAFWCPHCQDQKRDFGSAVKDVPYVECSTPDGSGQTEECAAAGITGYPTWVFADGVRLSGYLSLNTLAERTGCPAPEVRGETEV